MNEDQHNYATLQELLDAGYTEVTNPNTILTTDMCLVSKRSYVTQVQGLAGKKVKYLKYYTAYELVEPKEEGKGDTTVGGSKFDSNKVRLELLPSYSLWQIAKVLTFGAKKYDAHNWMQGIEYSRLYGALLRHITSWFDGEDVDEESGLSHLSHAGCCILFLIWMNYKRKDLDDRPIGNVNEDEIQSTDKEE